MNSEGRRLRETHSLWTDETGVDHERCKFNKILIQFRKGLQQMDPRSSADFFYVTEMYLEWAKEGRLTEELSNEIRRTLISDGCMPPNISGPRTDDVARYTMGDADPFDSEELTDDEPEDDTIDAYQFEIASS